jgi:hypothetical protein
MPEFQDYSYFVNLSYLITATILGGFALYSLMTFFKNNKILTQEEQNDERNSKKETKN